MLNIEQLKCSSSFEYAKLSSANMLNRWFMITKQHLRPWNMDIFIVCAHISVAWILLAHLSKSKMWTMMIISCRISEHTHTLYIQLPQLEMVLSCNVPNAMAKMVNFIRTMNDLFQAMSWYYVYISIHKLSTVFRYKFPIL